METNNKPAWDKLTDTQRNAWVQQVINFYPPNAVTPEDALELARDEYDNADSLTPV